MLKKMKGHLKDKTLKKIVEKLQNKSEYACITS